MVAHILSPKPALLPPETTALSAVVSSACVGNPDGPAAKAGEVTSDKAANETANVDKRVKFFILVSLFDTLMETDYYDQPGIGLKKNI